MTRWRPFWSYRIEETEQWLSEMASKGQHFTRINYLSQFEFEQGEKKKSTYLIDYASDTERLTQANWELVWQRKKWTLFTSEQATIFPSKEKAFKRFRTHFLVLVFLLSFLIPFITLPFLMMTILWGSVSYPVIWLAVIAVHGFLFGCIWVVYSYFRKKEKKYLGLPMSQRSKKAIRKMRIGWFYQPYYTKKWLNQLFEEGFELERASNLFFYFVPRSCEKISYEILYENSVNSSYYQLHQEMGWQLKHTSNTSYWNSSIWAMPYNVVEPEPKITYVFEERLQGMKRNLKMSTTIFGFLFLVNGFNFLLQLQINELFRQWNFLTVLTIINFVLSIYCVYFYFKAIQGYRLEKKMLYIEV
ncbi:hypothetical protein CSE16_13510 [Solibacillus sp. R5-41]|uniref:DUF2812 domain-containing protein n=1 Tax=Solibacillus sp. R5-41 TaxID=2048654 RepID=UPI000C127783|nr:DUF2812 domain-containing protein [Solibacillus sp. R5-41]ATP40988.1 hypothetical protein CSE16_13510 [Solibacillus sp. R5-41]